jgi:hypothetical protein
VQKTRTAEPLGVFFTEGGRAMSQSFTRPFQYVTLTPDQPGTSIVFGPHLVHNVEVQEDSAFLIIIGGQE